MGFPKQITTIPGEPALAIFSNFPSPVRKQRLGRINGTRLTECHPTNSVKALKETRPTHLSWKWFNPE